MLSSGMARTNLRGVRRVHVDRVSFVSIRSIHVRLATRIHFCWSILVFDCVLVNLTNCIRWPIFLKVRKAAWAPTGPHQAQSARYHTWRGIGPLNIQPRLSVQALNFSLCVLRFQQVMSSKTRGSCAATADCVSDKFIRLYAPVFGHRPTRREFSKS
jgi:hypothetical protein